MKYIYCTFLTLAAFSEITQAQPSDKTPTPASACEFAISAGEKGYRVESAALQFEEIFDFYRKLPNSVREDILSDDNVQLISDTYSQVTLDLAARFEIFKSYQNFTDHELRQLYVTSISRLKDSAGQTALRIALQQAYYRTLKLEDLAFEASFTKGITFPKESLNFEALNQMVKVQKSYLSAEEQKEKNQLWHNLVEAFRESVGRNTYDRFKIQVFQTPITTALNLEQDPRLKNTATAGLIIGSLTNGGQEVLNTLEKKLPLAHSNSLEFRGLRSILTLLEIAGNSFGRIATFADPEAHLLDPKLKITIDTALNGDSEAKEMALRRLINTVLYYQSNLGTPLQVSINMAHLFSGPN